MKAPIKYFGGKGTMYKNILEHFPEKGSYNTYIEPFGGSYSVGLKIDPPEIEIYNDLEKNVYSLYKVLSTPDMFEEFKRKCDLILYSEDIRALFMENLKNCDCIPIVDRAFFFFYVNRTSHNGVGGFSKNTYIRRGMSKSVSDFLSAIDRLPELHNRLSRVIVTNTNGIELVQKYNTPNVFLYCDPPYEQSTRTTTRYDVDMDRNGHIDFLNACINSKAKILISGYHCDLYDVLERNGFKKASFEVKTISGNFTRKTKTEYLYYNYETLGTHNGKP